MEKMLSTTEKIAQMKDGSLTCEKNAKDFLTNIENNNKKYNIFLETFSSALDRAKQLDKKRESGESLGKLFGLTVGLKSNISYYGATISCASKVLEEYRGTFTADAVKKLEEEDAIIIGIVNNDEFASGSSGENSAFGKTINPESPSRIPGGSSSGSAAAIAAKMCDITLGSDTGGSIRNPASHCGVVGVKPSYGRVSRFGLVDLSMSLDQIGPLSYDIDGCALVMESISGKSNNDSTTKNNEVLHYSTCKYRSLKIGIISNFEQFIEDDTIKDIYSSLQLQAEKQGHTIHLLDLKGVDLGVQAYYPIVYTEFYSGTRKFDGIKYGKSIDKHAGVEVLRRIAGGKIISKSEYQGAYYKKALKVKEIIAEEFEKAFNEVDIIIAPTTPTLPHTFSQNLTPQQEYANDIFTIPANLAGICGGVVPCKTILIDQESVPIGIQVFAGKFQEGTMFSGMKVIEELSKHLG